MTGSTIQINDKSFKIIRIISEGGYGFVYLVEDDNHKCFALKKVITQDQERYNVIQKELKFLQEHAQGPNPYFITFYDSKVVKISKSEFQFYILLEYGSGGTLFDIMAKRLEKETNFTEPEIICMITSVAKALKHVHKLGYVYCDMKIENCLFFDMNTIKLCDFGSVNHFDLDFALLPKSMHYKYEEVFEKETTLMYRPPEMCDPYLQYKVNQKADMWMLGCVIYTLMFFKHPFFESSKLAITTASFNWPDEPLYSDKLEMLVRNLLTPNPDLRPSSDNVVEILDNWQNATLQLNHMAIDIKRDKESKTNAIKHIGDKLPIKKVKNPNELGFDVFDFSGLNKISRKSHTPVNNHRQQNMSKSWSNVNTPNIKKTNNIINDDVFTKISKQSDNFDFFAEENKNPDSQLDFKQHNAYNFDCFGEIEQKVDAQNQFEDFLNLDVEESKAEVSKKELSRNDLDDFCNY